MAHLGNICGDAKKKYSYFLTFTYSENETQILKGAFFPEARQSDAV